MKKGFTLIELMVTIAIIAILTAIITTNFTQAKSKSRDAKRISDISQVQLAIELYGDRCNEYPPDNSGNLPTLESASGCPENVKLSTFISQMPTAPAGGGYAYVVNNSPATDYILRAELENDSNLDRFTGKKSWKSDFLCSGNYYCVVPR